jgi:hypothetical protein
MPGDRPRLSVILALPAARRVGDPAPAPPDAAALQVWLRTELAGLDAEILEAPAATGRAAAFAAAAPRARGALVAFLEAVALPSAPWLAPLLARLEADPDLAAAGPQCVDALGRTLPANVGLTWAALRGERLPPADPQPLSLALDGLVIRADDLRRAGGLPDGYRDRWAEVELCQGLVDAGRRFAQVPASVLPVTPPWEAPPAPGDPDEARLAAFWRARHGAPSARDAGEARVTLVPRETFVQAAVERMVAADVVLDIGCGIRPQPYVTPKVHVCCEPFGQYLERLQRDLAAAPQDRQHVLLRAGWEQAVELFPPGSVDTVFLLDIIEHLPKEQSLPLLRRTERLARKQVVVFTTLGFVAQHHPDGKDAWGLDGAAWQEHRSGWSPADFGEGWQVIVSPDFHTHDNLNRPYDVPRGALWAIHQPRPAFRVNRGAGR